jgi:Tetracyclin repressor-like, C-terminal domain
MDDLIATETPPLRQRIEQAYFYHLKAEGQPPVSIFKLCQTLGITEREFFSEYSTLEAVERSWWSGMMDRLITSVESGAEWPAFSARHRLLAFLFAFTTAALDHRSLLLLRLGSAGPLKSVPEWSALEERFEEFAKTVLWHGRQQGEIVSRGPVSAVYPKALRLLFRSVVAFYLKDESAKFERTDAFIEKSVAVLFDLMGRQVLDSGFDLLRFLLPGFPQRA